MTPDPMIGPKPSLTAPAEARQAGGEEGRAEVPWQDYEDDDKEYEEFGDLGCEYCDQRHPGWGIV